MAEERGYKFKKEGEGNTVLLIGVLLVLIVLTAAVLVSIMTQEEVEEPFPPYVPPNVTEPNVTNVTNVTEVPPPCDDQCLYERALRDKNYSDCQEIANATLVQQCYEQLSDVSLSACMALEDETKRGSCIKAFAVAEDDIALCDLLDVGVDECKEAVDPCLAAEDKNLCYALKDEDPSECKSDSDCLLNYSIMKGDTESCGLIQNPVVSTGCLSVIKFEDECKGLSAQSERDHCYQIYALYSNEFFICLWITDNSPYALDCYSTFAARTGNISLCDRDGFYLNTRWKCYTNYSLLSGDLDGCRQIDELATTHRFGCGFEYAKKYGNPAACQVIDSLSQRSTCYQGIIIYSNENLDWSYCDDVTDFDWRHKCFTEAAKLNDDISLCDYITVGYAKEVCQSSYRINKSG